MSTCKNKPKLIKVIKSKGSIVTIEDEVGERYDVDRQELEKRIYSGEVDIPGSRKYRCLGKSKTPVNGDSYILENKYGTQFNTPIWEIQDKLSVYDILVPELTIGKNNTVILRKDKSNIFRKVRQDRDRNIDKIEAGAALAKARILGIDGNETFFKYLCSKDKNAEKILHLEYENNTSQIKFIDSDMALQHPKYSRFVTSMSGLFYHRKMYKANFSDFDTSNVTDMSKMFYGCNVDELDLSSFNTSKVRNMEEMFCKCELLRKLNISNFNTSRVSNMQKMFASCCYLENLGLSSFDTSNVTSMHRMFAGCSSLQSLDLSKFDTSGVTNMNQMFSHCVSLVKLDLSNFDTSLVNDMESMFQNCESLTELKQNFDTSQVTSMRDMFNSCKDLKELNIKNFDTFNVTSMRGMFLCCANLQRLLLNFDTSNVLSMRSMFWCCEKMTDLDIRHFQRNINLDDQKMIYGLGKYIAKSNILLPEWCKA